MSSVTISMTDPGVGVEDSYGEGRCPAAVEEAVRAADLRRELIGSDRRFLVVRNPVQIGAGERFEGFRATHFEVSLDGEKMRIPL